MGNCMKQETREGAAVQLSDEAITHLILNTGLEREIILEWHRNFIKDCPDGRLTRSKFEKTYSSFNELQQIKKNGNANKFCKYLFRSFDKDRNGFIDFSEFLLGITLMSSRDRIVEKLRFIFDIYDLDGDGRIDQKEMIKVIECLYDLRDLPKSDKSGEKSPKFIAKQIMSKFDKDGNKSLTQNEFIDGCLEYAQTRLLLMPSSA